MQLGRALVCVAAFISACALPAVAQDQVSVPAATAVPAASPGPTASPLPRPSPLPEPSRSPAANPSAFVFSIPSPVLSSPGATVQAQSYTVFMHGAQPLAGVLNLVRKDDDLYIDLGPDDFNKTFIISPSLASGVGSGAFAGRMYEPFLVTFKRVGKRVLWMSPNTRYVAAKGSAQARSLAVSVADSVLLSTPVVAEDPAHLHTVIAPSIFLTDFESIGADLGRSTAAPSLPGLLVIGSHPAFTVDATKSYYTGIKAFPRNDEIAVNLTFTGPQNALPTVPDGRGIPIIVHYSIVQPPDPDPHFVPRYADDRVGYFITARKRYDDDALATPFERFVERWNLDSGPITFYLTNEIPFEYRATVRRGILAWNDAFARIGRRNVIEVKDQPADPNWDPDDIRYSTVRWITSDRSDFSAYSPSVVDPKTGQIFRAEVVIDGESLRAIKRGYVDSIVPVRRMEDAFALPGDAAFDAQTCELAEGSLAQAALGTLLMASNPQAKPRDRERYATDWLYATVMHEVGHTLGLRHNFMGSTAFTPAQLHNPEFTRLHGTTASVMDYTPVNLAAPGQRQADYFTNRLGVYDYWAIQYGYQQFSNTHSSAEELPYLQKIAARSTQPGLGYGTDEDAVDPLALDPHIARFDLSSDPLAFDRDQLALNEHLAQQLERPYPGDTRSYTEIRQSFVTILNNELAATDLAAHYIGGMYTSRSHRGQAGAAPPFRPISRVEQRRAFDLIDRYVFSSQAFRYSPRLLNDLTTSRYGLHWDSGGLRRADFPIREVIAEIQDDTIIQIFSASNLSRIADEALKVDRPGDTMTLADLFAWSNRAIFDDIGAPAIAPAHRDLQRRFADLEMQLALLPSFALDQLGMTREVQSLARASLIALSHRLGDGRATDPGTRAHLDDLRSRIRGTLAPATTRPL